MADYTPVHNPGNEITLTTSAAVTGGQVLIVTGVNTVGPSTAATDAWIGVAAFDAASGSRVTVFVGGMVHESTASGAITAGGMVAAAAGGQVAAAGAATFGQVLGVALTSATNGQAVRWVKR